MYIYVKHMIRYFPIYSYLSSFISYGLSIRVCAAENWLSYTVGKLTERQARVKLHIIYIYIYLCIPLFI